MDGPESSAPLGEFELIGRYFTRPARRATLGIGDDCALLQIAPGQCLATSTDLLVEGRHFLSTVDPHRLGHKALAVNLSDLAACGAQPLAFTLALCLPQADPAFLSGFSKGLLALADAHDCELIGGDTTRGPLTLGITVYGQVPAHLALRRDAAHAGDDIYISGTLGDARLALEAFRGSVVLPGQTLEQVRSAMETPQPRVALGLALRGLAHAAIDLSDGLLGDLGHILARSQLGATLDVDAVPRSDALAALAPSWQRLCTLDGGDDYELLFTAPADRAAAVAQAGVDAGVPVTRIGRMESAPGLRLIDAQGGTVAHRGASFDHFKAGPQE